MENFRCLFVLRGDLFSEKISRSSDWQGLLTDICCDEPKSDWLIDCLMTRPWLQMSEMPDRLFVRRQKNKTEAMAAKIWFVETGHTGKLDDATNLYYYSNDSHITPENHEEYMIQAKRLEPVLDLQTYKQCQDHANEKGFMWVAQIPRQSFCCDLAVTGRDSIVTLLWLYCDLLQLRCDFVMLFGHDFWSGLPSCRSQFSIKRFVMRALLLAIEPLREAFPLVMNFSRGRRIWYSEVFAIRFTWDLSRIPDGSFFVFTAHGMDHEAPEGCALISTAHWMDPQAQEGFQCFVFGSQVVDSRALVKCVHRDWSEFNTASVTVLIMWLKVSQISSKASWGMFFGQNLRGYRAIKVYYAEDDSFHAKDQVGPSWRIWKDAPLSWTSILNLSKGQVGGISPFVTQRLGRTRTEERDKKKETNIWRKGRRRMNDLLSHSRMLHSMIL